MWRAEGEPVAVPLEQQQLLRAQKRDFQKSSRANKTISKSAGRFTDPLRMLADTQGLLPASSCGFSEPAELSKAARLCGNVDAGFARAEPP